MLEIGPLTQIKEDLSNCVFQQDGAPAHWATEVLRFLNTELPRSWVGHSGPDDLILHSWPSRSPDMTPCDFFLREILNFEDSHCLDIVTGSGSPNYMEINKPENSCIH
ncbi:hypothetical protein AVEN_20884-1 [Araneus ventricosus]|uniref:Tc1-like transposase DDE domain-containing protein n=1 Tax=Araneus ventricosus TaxID=182803 RepID=A0A4Y2KK95_ARAVE|nr:hypothetical protein AVEN_20884-1 [Araneus ventricosus]